MRVLKTRKNDFDFYCHEMSQHGYKVPYTPHYKKLVKGVSESLGEKFRPYVKLLAKHFEEIKDTFYEERFTKVGFPHPALFNNKDILKFIKDKYEEEFIQYVGIDQKILPLLGEALREEKYAYIRELFSRAEEKRLFVTTLVYAMRTQGIKVTRDKVERLLY